MSNLQKYLANDARRIAQLGAEAQADAQAERARQYAAVIARHEAEADAEAAAKRAEHEARAEAMAAAEQARVKQMIPANFAGTAAEFESSWPTLWQRWRDDAALQRARDEQQARRNSIASRF